MRVKITQVTQLRTARDNKKKECILYTFTNFSKYLSGFVSGPMPSLQWLILEDYAVTGFLITYNCQFDRN